MNYFCLFIFTNCTIFSGLLYIIETQKVLDLKINLMASYIIVPQKGFYDHTSNLLLLDLGSFKVCICPMY